LELEREWERALEWEQELEQERVLEQEQEQELELELVISLIEGRDSKTRTLQMWILPPSIISAFAPGTEALISDSAELSKICERSLTLKSSFSPAKTWLRRCKQDIWTQHLFGPTLKPFLGLCFEEWWTFCLEGSRANPSALLESGLETKTQDTSSRTFLKELESANLPLFFWKTSKESCRQNLQETAGETQQEPLFCSMSSENWNAWVTRQRQEYSQRRNASMQVDAQHRINANECSSLVNWPTPDLAPDAPNSGSNKRNTPKNFKEALSWPTASTRDYKGTFASRITPEGYNSRLDEAVIVFGQADPENPNSHGNRQESWLTPRASEPTGDSNFVARMGDRGEHCHGSLASQAKCWATPNTRDWKDNGTTQPPSIGETRGFSLGQQMVTTRTPGKLNPRWVETLMGLPVGWTMPSCASPVTTAQMNCAYSETE